VTLHIFLTDPTQAGPERLRAEDLTQAIGRPVAFPSTAWADGADPCDLALRGGSALATLADSLHRDFGRRCAPVLVPGNGSVAATPADPVRRAVALSALTGAAGITAVVLHDVILAGTGPLAPMHPGGAAALGGALVATGLDPAALDIRACPLTPGTPLDAAMRRNAFVHAVAGAVAAAAPATGLFLRGDTVHEQLAQALARLAADGVDIGLHVTADAVAAFARQFLAAVVAGAATGRQATAAVLPDAGAP
jgi:hypothetical protein